MRTIKIELIIERPQRLAIRRTNNPTQTWCGDCGEMVAMVSGEEGARLIGKRSREIYRQAEQGLLHTGEEPDGTLLICVKSLFASANRQTQTL